MNEVVTKEQMIIDESHKNIVEIIKAKHNIKLDENEKEKEGE